MQIDLYRDEAFPVYYGDEVTNQPFGKIVDIDEVDWSEGQKIEAAYDDWQLKLHDLWRKANPGK